MAASKIVENSDQKNPRTPRPKTLRLAKELEPDPKDGWKVTQRTLREIVYERNRNGEYIRVIYQYRGKENFWSASDRNNGKYLKLSGWSNRGHIEEFPTWILVKLNIELNEGISSE